MAGAGRVRFCGSCEKNVFDLSAMSSSEAEELLAANGVKPCIRLQRRVDGTVVTGNCTRMKRQSALSARCATAIAGAFMAVALTACGGVSDDETVHASVIGHGVSAPSVAKANTTLELAPAPPEPPPVATATTTQVNVLPPRPRPHTMGVVAVHDIMGEVL